MLGGGSALQEVSDVSIVSDADAFFSEQQQDNQRKGKMFNLPYKKNDTCYKNTF